MIVSNFVRECVKERMDNRSVREIKDAKDLSNGHVNLIAIII